MVVVCIVLENTSQQINSGNIHHLEPTPCVRLHWKSYYLIHFY